MTAFAINNLSKNYGPRTLFKPTSIQFALGSCYGIVGANGSGKSTMLKIMAGTEEASDGEVNIPRKMRVGVLGQDQFEYDAVPILDVVLMGQPELWAAMVERREILENADESFDADRYGELEDIFQLYNGYSVEARAAEILEGLGIPTDVHDQPMRALSGGYRIRALMARTLAAEPDILLLDEPTNHLDIISIQWLERFLRGFKGCTVVVSHDRDFLNTVCTHIIDIDYQLATLYKGNYAQFERLLTEDRSRRESQIEKREKEIKSHKAWIDKVKAKPSKARQAQSKVKQMMRIVIEHLPESTRRHPRFNIKQNRPSGKQVVEAAGIEKSYGEKKVLHGIDLRVQRGDRLAIVGPNGIGKSTLLGILTGTNEADDGVFEWGYQTHVGNFSQDHRELAGHDEATIIDWLWTMHSTLGPGQVRGKLAEVLFGKDEIDKKVGHLSGGERTRLIFSHLSTAKPNVLVLDEPTNHLDIEGIEALADGIEAFDGTTIFVSHDRWFVSRLATRILALTPQGARDFQGTWSEYLARFGDDYLDGEVQARKKKKKKKSK